MIKMLLKLGWTAFQVLMMYVAFWPIYVFQALGLRNLGLVLMVVWIGFLTLVLFGGR